MPGHKGFGPLGIEERDLTEVFGADVLSEASGIIAESEKNAAHLFQSGMTLFSTEGSSLCVRAMLYLCLQRFLLFQKKEPLQKRPFVLAARNVHKSFVYACAALDLDVVWIYPDEKESHSICSCRLTESQISAALSSLSSLPIALYLTSPDYLGNMTDVKAIAACLNARYGEYGLPLVVDNAHGSYLHFLDAPSHPMDAGAYLCCDSAHKTLPCLTGGAYLHLSRRATKEIGALSRRALDLFSSTSPSYLILQSLDLCNLRLFSSYRSELSACISKVNHLKKNLEALSVSVLPGEPLKIVIDTGSLSGGFLAECLRKAGIEAEFSDIDRLVFMFTPDTPDSDYLRVLNFFKNFAPRFKANAACHTPLFFPRDIPTVCSIREAVFGAQEIVSLENSVGRICGQLTVSCPPAIPVAVSGERILPSLLPILHAYGIRELSVLKTSAM